MLSLGATVLGVEDMPRALAFWTEALGYRTRRPPDEYWAVLHPPDGVEGAPLALIVSRAKAQIPPRIHLHLYADDQENEVARLEALGAQRIEWDGRPEGADFVILEDIEGNRFCVVEAPGWFKSNSRSALLPEPGR